jgi:hypothetical protein
MHNQHLIRYSMYTSSVLFGVRRRMRGQRPDAALESIKRGDHADREPRWLGFLVSIPKWIRPADSARLRMSSWLIPVVAPTAPEWATHAEHPRGCSG